MGEIERRMERMNFRLPAPDRRYESVARTRRAGRLLFVTAQLSHKRGRAGVTCSAEEIQEAGRALARRFLAELQDELGTLDRVDYFVKMLGVVSAGGDYSDMPQAMNAFSGVLTAVFGQRGLHARSAVGAPELPGGVLMSVDMIVCLREPG